MVRARVVLLLQSFLHWWTLTCKLQKHTVLRLGNVLHRASDISVPVQHNAPAGTLVTSGHQHTEICFMLAVVLDTLTTSHGLRRLQLPD